MTLHEIFKLLLTTTEEEKPKKKPAKRSNPYALPTTKKQIMDRRRRTLEFFNQLVTQYRVVKASYYTRHNAEYLKTDSYTPVKEEDLLPGVECSHANYVMLSCHFLAAQYYNAEDTIQNAKEAEAKYIQLIRDRANPKCDRVIKDKRYSLKDNSKIPLYPCSDCLQEKPCTFYYKVIF